MTTAVLLREPFEDGTMNEDEPASRFLAGEPNMELSSLGGVPAEAQRAANAASRQAAQRFEIETKLNALFKALDHTPRRSDHAANAGGRDAPDEDRRIDALLGQTAISPSWRLEKAIGEIAERRAFLEGEATVDGAAPAVSQRVAHRLAGPGAAADDVRRRFEPPASTGSQSASAEPAGRDAAHGVPSIFTTLQGDIARLAKRLDAVHFDVSRRPPARKEASFDEIRTLLGEIRPDPSIDTLGRSVEALAAKLDEMNQNRVSPDAISRLTQRIEDVHAEVMARLSAQSAEPVVDMGAIEHMIRDLVARADRPAQAPPDLRGLEEAVQDLVGKLDRAERAQDGPELLAELQSQVGTLARRIDKSDAGLAAIVAMERSLGEIFAQMGEMREAAIQTAESTARAAAEDTLRSAIAELKLPQRPSDPVSDSAVEQVTQELADLRTRREDADRRLHTILAALNTSLERVVDRLSALEEDVAEARHRPMPAAPPVLGAGRAVPVSDIGADAPYTATRPSPRPAPVPLDLDVPIEPGTAMRPRAASLDAAAAADAPPLASSAPDPTSFIAAARRAAQAAMAEQVQKPDGEAAGRRRVAGLVADPDRAKRLKTGMLSRRRPLLLVLAGLIVLVGAAQLVRLSLSANEPSLSPPSSDTTVTTPAPVAPPAAGPGPRADAGDAATTVAAPIAPAPDATTADAGAATAPAGRTSDGPASAKGEATPSNVDPAVTRKSLPTMAMGPAANLAAVQAADLAGRVAAAGGIAPGLKALADAGDAGASYEVGLRYADGRGVPRDLATAATFFEKAGRQGLAPAAYRLGSLYEKGLGVSRDPAQSITWYQKAAEAGNVRAMHNLAVMLAEGASGKSDYATAASWFTKAAEAGVRDSQYNLAILFARGMGVEQNLAKSYTWFAIAAANGDVDSAKKRDEVAGRLDADALAGAKKAVDDFKPAPPVAAANEVAVPPGGWDAALATKPGSSAGSKPAANAHVSRL